MGAKRGIAGVIGVEHFPITDNADAANAGYVQLGANDGAVFYLLHHSLSVGCKQGAVGS